MDTQDISVCIDIVTDFFLPLFALFLRKPFYRLD